MYGGNAPNDVTYYCGVTVGSKNQVNIEGIDVPLRKDPPHERFRRLLSSYRFDKKAKVHYCELQPFLLGYRDNNWTIFCRQAGSIWQRQGIRPYGMLHSSRDRAVIGVNYISLTRDRRANGGGARSTPFQT